MIATAENPNTRNTVYMKAVTDFVGETIKCLSGEPVNAWLMPCAPRTASEMRWGFRMSGGT